MDCAGNRLDQPGGKDKPGLTGEIESKHVVIATIGSLGDLHPCLALALELERRGHRVTIASTEFYRDKVEELGIAFHRMRPNWNPTDRELIRQCEDLQSGFQERCRFPLAACRDRSRS